MKKARILLAVIIVMAAAGGALATKARVFIGYVNNGGIYLPVYMPFDCPDTGLGCIYTSYNGATFQVYTLSGLRFYPVQP